MKQFLRLALLFRHRASCALDVRAGARVAAIEEQHPRPDVDGLCVVGGKILIETGKQKALDLGVALGVTVGRGGIVDWIRAKRIGHARGQIMRQNQL